MPYRFSGEFDELKEKLASISQQGQWSELNESQFQFRHYRGGIMNWFPSTGTIQFQGKPDGRSQLQKLVVELLFGSEQQPSKPPSPAATTVETESNGNEAEPKEDTSSINQVGRPVTDPGATLGRSFVDSELIIGLVGAVGTELNKVVEILEARLKVSKYDVHQVRISRHVIPRLVSVPKSGEGDEYERITRMMDAGNQARQMSNDNSILALGAASRIASLRDKDSSGQPKHAARRACIVVSLKHPEEVHRLREIYPQGFYLIGVYSDEKRRQSYLEEDKRIDSLKAQRLMLRDEDEHIDYGQRVTDTFHLSDFFIRLDGDDDRLKESLWRVLDILFGHPYRTPTFDEYAMFLAFSASLRSGDLARQVGAVIAKDREIIATGANDCPKFGGGLYWPEFNDNTKRIEDQEGGRDYTRGEDANKVEQQKIIGEILDGSNLDGAAREAVRKALATSRIKDLTEFGRVVHAEMEALLSCARNHISTRESVLYCTTFPCHNCAKHIIAAGLKRVVYIEPYPKSKAEEFHSDALTLGFTGQQNVVRFEPFVGVGPRRFFDLFSMRIGSGRILKRKDSYGQTLDWTPEDANLRIQLLPCSYLDLELVASNMFNRAIATEDSQSG